MKSLIFGFFLFLFLLALPAMGQSPTPMENIQYIPQIVGGGDYDCRLLLKNSSALPGDVTVEFFDSQGAPMIFNTSLGQRSSFTISLGPIGMNNSNPLNPSPVPPNSTPPASEEILLLRQGPLLVGWARVRSIIKANVSVIFRQYSGAHVTGMAGILPSPTRLAFSVELDPYYNGFALVNPNREVAQVRVRVFAEDGSEVIALERNLTMNPGEHFAKYFFEPPFSYGGQKGLVVFSSNVPLSPVAFRLEGPTFGTIPISAPPRRVDMPPEKKIGVVYFVPSDREPQPNVAERAGEAFEVFQKFLDREMPLNGFEFKELPVDRDENGLPKVILVRGEKPNSGYLLPEAPGQDWLNGTIDLNAIATEVNKLDLSSYSSVVVFVETFVLHPDKLPTGLIACAFPKSPNSVGKAWVSSFTLPFLKQELFGNAGSFFGIPIPEFGGQVISTFASSWPYFGSTLEQAADGSFGFVAHELVHAFGTWWHSSVGGGDLNLQAVYASIMGDRGQTGLFRENGKTQSILLPIDAKFFSMSPSLNPDYYGLKTGGSGWIVEDSGWVKMDKTQPNLNILSKELVGNELHVVAQAQDEETGISIVAIVTPMTPCTLYYKEFTHTDPVGVIDIRVKLYPLYLSSYLYYGIFLVAVNHQGYVTQVPLTPF